MQKSGHEDFKTATRRYSALHRRRFFGRRRCACGDTPIGGQELQGPRHDSRCKERFVPLREVGSVTEVATRKAKLWVDSQWFEDHQHSASQYHDGGRVETMSKYLPDNWTTAQ